MKLDDINQRRWNKLKERHDEHRKKEKQHLIEGSRLAREADRIMKEWTTFWDGMERNKK